MPSLVDHLYKSKYRHLLHTLSLLHACSRRVWLHKLALSTCARSVYLSIRGLIVEESSNPALALGSSHIASVRWRGHPEKILAELFVPSSCH
eukprot:scaffold37465_cov444-Skeletonema_dohrnii-CCMP3373.AAC.2